jgi:hypothetical protein
LTCRDGGAGGGGIGAEGRETGRVRTSGDGERQWCVRTSPPRAFYMCFWQPAGGWTNPGARRGARGPSRGG